jgi:hypothetical protein
VKLIRLFSRLALLSLVAAGFVLLTSVYGGPVRSPRLPEPEWLGELQRLPSWPQVGYLYELIGGFMVVAVCAVAGRIVFRLRLSPASRSKGQMVLLDLDWRPREQS